MRLYLASFEIGQAAHELVALAPSGRVGLIMNALDNREASRLAWLTRQTRQLEALGFAVTAVDLRTSFGQEGRLASELANLDMVWINGGNTFILRRAMRLSGFDRLIKERLAEDSIVYAGFSAATVVAAPDLRGLEAVDDPDDVPAGYPRDIIWDGLGLLPFHVAVHYQSDHSESALVEREIAFYQREGLPYRTLRDGEAFVVRGTIDRLRVVG